MASPTVSGHDARQVAALLALPEIAQLITNLEALHWTGRPGFPVKSLVGAALVKAVYCLPTWTRTASLVAEHAALREAIGGAPSVHALYRFAGKLRKHGDVLSKCIDSVLAALHEAKPEMGKVIAVDGSDLPAYGNGQKYVRKGGPERKKFSDPDASWGHRSAVSTRAAGSFYGFKVHAVTDTATDLPLAWTIRTAKDPELPELPGLLDDATRRGFTFDVVVCDKGYDAQSAYELIESKHARPVIPLVKTKAVKDGKHKPPECEHGTWTFAGSDAKRGASKWRCPTSEGEPKSVWVKASRLHTLIPRSTDRFRFYYRKRGSVERGFGRVKHEWGGLPLRVRRIPRVKLHVDLCILAMLGAALLATRTT